MKTDLSGSVALLIGTWIPFWLASFVVPDLSDTDSQAARFGLLVFAFFISVKLISTVEKNFPAWLNWIVEAAHSWRTPHLVLIGMGAAATTTACLTTLGMLAFCAAVDMLFTIAIVLCIVAFAGPWYGTLALAAKLLNRPSAGGGRAGGGRAGGSQV